MVRICSVGFCGVFVLLVDVWLMLGWVVWGVLFVLMVCGREKRGSFRSIYTLHLLSDIFSP